jgi:hypothetical protein
MYVDVDLLCLTLSIQIWTMKLHNQHELFFSAFDSRLILFVVVVDAYLE